VVTADAEPAERALKGGKLARKKHFQYGSLFKRGKKNKVWVARYWEPVIGTSGEPQRVRRSEILGSVAEIPTKRDAEIVLSNLLRTLNSANYNPRSCCLFRDFVEEWKSQALPALKYATQTHYEYVINIHLLPVFGNVQLRLISRESIQALLATKLKDLSWRTVKHIRTTLGTILGTAEVWGYIEDNPVRKTRLPRRGPRPEKQVLSPEQLRQLLGQLPEPSKSLVWLLVLTGLRIGELLALRWQDIDLEAGALRVRRTLYEGHFDEPKTRTSNRTVPLGPEGVAILRSRKPEATNGEALVFGSQKGTPLCRRNLSNRQLAPICKALGLPRISWHCLRHCNATLLDSVGTPLGTVQALLGHSTPEITREIYLHSLPAGARDAVEKVEALLIGPKRTQIEEIQNLGSTLIQ
jgi:integrase